jgi:hypothetical protein
MRAMLNAKRCLFLLMHASRPLAVPRLSTLIVIDREPLRGGIPRILEKSECFRKECHACGLYNPVLAIRRNTFLRRERREDRNDEVDNSATPKGQGTVGRSVNQSIRFIRARASADAYLPETT